MKIYSLRRCLSVVFFSLFLVQTIVAQEVKFWIFFTDKTETGFNPETYFHPKALERRILNNLPLYDATDLPVNAAYIQKCEDLGVSTRVASRWLNVLVATGDISLRNQLEALPFVSGVEVDFPFENEALITDYTKSSPYADSLKIECKNQQLAILGLKAMEAENLDGSGVRVAVFDVGFTNVDVHPAFKHLHDNNQIALTYDFVRKKTDVYGHGTHGTSTLSNIGGYWESDKIGLAPKATYLLARTEHGMREPFSEEENWLAAAEWADKNGVDIISSSLGYTKKRYTTDQMDGTTSFVAKAAKMAFEKGILVVNSAGNEGSQDKWRIIGTPADCKEVLAVGGIEIFSNYHISFSSFGPNAVGQMKPNVAAHGMTAAAGAEGYKIAYGTSFACPLISGYAAILKQKYPDLTAKQLFEMIESDGHLFPYYDYAHGYGVPTFERHLNRTNIAKSFEVKVLEKEIELKLLKEPGDFTNKIVYIQWFNSAGELNSYGARLIEGEENKVELKPNSKVEVRVRITYQGYQKTIDLE